MEFRLPQLSDENILMDYIHEHHAAGEQSISASLGLPVMDYYAWVEKINANANEGDDEWGKSLLYLCFDGQRLVGLLSIRYELSRELSEKFGDIGYGVRPALRCRGYATQMLVHALDICRAKGMPTVIVGCFADNRASAAVIEKCGGVLFAENDNFKPGLSSRYYHINL